MITEIIYVIITIALAGVTLNAIAKKQGINLIELFTSLTAWKRTPSDECKEHCLCRTKTVKLCCRCKHYE